MAVQDGARVRALYSCEHWEIVKPSVSELSREVRTNILCTVKGCGKVLPNPPALNMHLVKSHGVQEGICNPTLRKDLKASQKLYCCPVEGCPRGTNRPFSQFSRVKQHFMKMHAEKKHKCEKCGSSYGTEWDLKRHIGYCGKTFKCTCGCPYTSRTALLSHTHRMGHEVPIEHRDPPVKKRKLDALKQRQKTVTEESIVKNDQPEAVMTSDQQMTELKALPSSDAYIASYVTGDTPSQPNQAQKLLLPKPKLAVVKFPIMQLAHLPVLVSASDCPMKPVVVAVNSGGPVISTLQIVPQYNGTVLQSLDTETSLSSNLHQASCLGAANSYVQVSMDRLSPADSNSTLNDCSTKNKITSDVQTDLSYFTPSILQDAWTASESCVSSYSQTDLSFTAEMSLPISVETQTLQDCSSLPLKSQSEVSINTCLTCGISRETQTSNASLQRDTPLLVDQAVNCDNIFNNTNSFYTVSTQTSQPDSTYIPGSLEQNLLNTETMKDIRVEEMKPPSFINFSTQNGTFPSQNMTDNQTQTMELLSDLEKILSDNISSQSLDNRNLLSGAESHLSSNCNPNTGIDFDIDEFFSASNIQTQTEESMLSNLNSEYLDIETQTDFLFSNDSTQSFSNKGSSNLLGMETFDTQTQTDLNLFLDRHSHLRLGSLLKQSSFSISTDSSDAECHTDGASTSRNGPCPALEGHVQHNSAQTQTSDSCFETLGSLFLTSNETQTAMDDFLLADLAWNTMESQFSSVETQTCEDRFTLFSEKSDN